MPGSTVVTSAAVLESPVLPEASAWEVLASVLELEPEAEEPLLPPQAARLRAMVRVRPSARSFFVIRFNLLYRPGPVARSKQVVKSILLKFIHRQ